MTDMTNFECGRYEFTLDKFVGLVNSTISSRFGAAMIRRLC